MEEEDQDKITGHFLHLLNEVERSFNNPDRPVIAPMAANSSGHVATGSNGGTTEPTGANSSGLDRARNKFLQSGEADDLQEQVVEEGPNNRNPPDNFDNELDFRSKPRVNAQKLPWRSRNLGRAPVADPVLRETQRQLKLFAQDTKTVLSDLRVAENKPPFPVNEWENIILGCTVDLEKVYVTASMGRFDSQQSLDLKDEGIEKPKGETRRTGKLVSNSGNWLIAWDATK